MKDRRAAELRHVSAIVDGDERSVLGRHARHNRLQLQFVADVQRLVAQLHDVHAAGQGSVQEVLEITGVAPRVGAQIQASLPKPLPDVECRCGHVRQSATAGDGRHATVGGAREP